jgi:hypothetical protein
MDYSVPLIENTKPLPEHFSSIMIFSLHRASGERDIGRQRVSNLNYGRSMAESFLLCWLQATMANANICLRSNIEINWRTRTGSRVLIVYIQVI